FSASVTGAIAAPSLKVPLASAPPRWGGSTWRLGRPRQRRGGRVMPSRDNAGTELQKPQADGVELGRGERVRPGNGVSDREDQPVGGSVQNDPHLVGERTAAAGAVGGELRLVQFDEILGLTSGAVERLVD